MTHPTYPFLERDSHATSSTLKPRSSPPGTLPPSPRPHGFILVSSPTLTPTTVMNTMSPYKWAWTLACAHINHMHEAADRFLHMNLVRSHLRVLRQLSQPHSPSGASEPAGAQWYYPFILESIVSNNVPDVIVKERSASLLRPPWNT